jgi:penicillin-binding protein 1A
VRGPDGDGAAGRWATYLGALAMAGVIVPIAVVSTLTAALYSLPSGELPPEERPGSRITRIYAGDGTEIATLHDFETFIPMSEDDIPASLKDAVIAIEDERFASHRGIDGRAVLRALWTNMIRGRVLQGGSTITQQYVKQAYMGEHDRTLWTKLQEAVLAVRVERELSKDEILHRYLLTVYFGAGAYGAGAAAEGYFRKHVRDLTLSEAAVLAAVIRAPTALNPRANPTGAERRRRVVLRRMREQGRITEVEYSTALARPIAAGTEDDESVTLVYPARQGRGSYPYFVDYVHRYLVSRHGEDAVLKRGLRVETSLNRDLQRLAEAAVAEGLSGTEAPLEMSLVSIDPRNGLVRALVGGRDFDRSQVNLALGGCPGIESDDGTGRPCISGGGTGRQPGSAFKVFPLARALEVGMSLDSIYPAPARYSFPRCKGEGCTVSNSSRRSYGRLTLRKALANSVNTVFAQLIDDVGVRQTAQLAHRMGITSIDPDGRLPNGEQYGPSLALGAAEVSPLDMAAAYSVLANEGVRVPASPILKVTAADGEVLEDNTSRRGHPVLSAAVAAQVTAALQDVIEYGTGTTAAVDVASAAGKTGTAENHSDAWFVGFTRHLSTAVWMGYSDSRRPLTGIRGEDRVYGGSIPAETWAAFMGPALEDSAPAAR